MIEVALALIQHDPAGSLFDQTVRVMPSLQQAFADIAVFANAATASRSIDYLRDRGVRVTAADSRLGLPHLGWSRRSAVQSTLQGPCPFMIYCDFDRILHWMEFIRKS